MEIQNHGVEISHKLKCSCQRGMEQSKNGIIYKLGYSNKWRKHKILIIASQMQWNTRAILKNELQDISGPNLYLRSFRDSLLRNALMILALLLPVSWIVAKFTFIEIIFVLHEKNNLKHLYIPTRNWDINLDIIRRCHCITWENTICINCVYLPEIDTFIGMRMFPTVHHSVTLVLSHIHKHTYITDGFILISKLLSLKLGVWLFQ